MTSRQPKTVLNSAAPDPILAPTHQKPGGLAVARLSSVELLDWHCRRAQPAHLQVNGTAEDP